MGPEQITTVTVDSREAPSGIPRRLAALPSVLVETLQLECGDYVLAPGVVLERKAQQDFAASILDGRLMPQIKLMKAEWQKVVVLIEGSIHDTRSAIAPASLHGALSWLTMLEGVSLVYSRDAADSAELIATMARHLHHGLGYEIALRQAKPKDLRAQQQYIVEGLPGIGPGRAQALIAHFGSVRAVLMASDEQLAKAPGVGPKSAKKVVEILQAAWR